LTVRASETLGAAPVRVAVRTTSMGWVHVPPFPCKHTLLPCHVSFIMLHATDSICYAFQIKETQFGNMHLVFALISECMLQRQVYITFFR
jgi:hypothetical protein